jgi:hypothetical protein
MNRKLVTLLFCLLWLGNGLSPASPLDTAFTYQGRLEINSQPATGAYLMRFSLWDSLTLGTERASVPTNTIPVTNGLFTVNLDFGASHFEGEDRWLQIEVWPNGSLQKNVLTPRTRLAPAPNALYATKAGTVTDGAIKTNQLGTTGSPLPGQVLAYNGSALEWRPPEGSIWALNGATAYYNGGNVGIGTTTPFNRFEVAGDGNFQSHLSTSGNLIMAGHETEATLGIFRIYGYSPPQFPNPTARFIVQRNGFVGIGTPSPSAVLDVVGNWDGQRPALQLRGQKPTIRFLGDAASGNQNWILHLGSEGPGNLQFMRRDQFIDERVLTLGANNNVGIGTPTPTEKLHVAGEFLRVDGAGGEAAYIGGDGQGGEVHLGSLNSDVTKVAFYNQSSQTYMQAVVCALTIMGGCDLAEPFPMKEETIEKGSVVVIDHEHPGRLKRSTHAYDKRVAGIVSGANGINPGIALKQEGVMDQGENVALTGRVYVKADASFGAIEPGDLLTTSDTPGHAMKASDSARAQGAILGKAMSALKDGSGLVLVLVTLQ